MKQKNETGCIVHDGAAIGSSVTLGHGAIIYPNVFIGDGTVIGPYSIIGEPAGSFYSADAADVGRHEFKKTVIGAGSVVRSHSVIYENVTVGEGFQSGHRVTIREKTSIGEHCSVGTLSDIQGYASIGNHTRMHSNVHIGQYSDIGDFVWIYPYVVLTNDPYPPMGKLQGVTVKSYAQICASSTVLPGIVIGENALVGAHSVVTRNVGDERLVVGNPAVDRGSVRDIRDRDGNSVYPWKDHLEDYRGYPWQKRP